jgi:RNA polymerase sigma-70 factor (ECF subfamily)
LCLYLLNFTNDKSTAEEIAQLVFVDFWNKRNSIEVRASIKSYLHKMAYNQFLMEMRKKKKEISIMEVLKYEALQPNEIHSEAEIEQKHIRLQHSINNLPERCQEVLKLKMAGLKYKDIAKTLNLSVKTVESQIRIAFIKIREDYKDDLMFFILLIG